MIPSAGHNWQTKRKLGSERGGFELSINWKHGAGGTDDCVWISNLLLTSQTTQSIKALNSMVMYTIKLERPYTIYKQAYQLVPAILLLQAKTTMTKNKNINQQTEDDKQSIIYRGNMFLIIFYNYQAA